MGFYVNPAADIGGMSQGSAKMKIRNKKGQPLPRQIDGMIQQFVEQSLKAYAPHIKRIILFGSYARGDFREDSDIDVMVLVDYPREEMGRQISGLSHISYDISYDNDFIEINPIVQNVAFFEKWIQAYPFYNNVASEGIQLYGN